MAENVKRLRDGFLDALGGVDSSNDPDAIAPNALPFAVNVSLRGGFPETRPGFFGQTLGFATDGIKDWWANRIFQGAREYKPKSGDSCLLASVGGRLFKVDPPNKFYVTEITPTTQTTLVADQISPPINSIVNWAFADMLAVLIGTDVVIGDGTYLVTDKNAGTVFLKNLDATPGVLLAAGTPVIYITPNSSINQSVWWEQAEEYMVMQDGEGRAWIYDGASARKAANDEVPVGTAMKYHRGRLAVAVNGNEVAFGDICKTNDHANLLKFTEEIGTAGERVRFRVGSNITAMVEMPSLDASLGQGPLQVITQDSFNSFDLPPARELWSTLTYPFQTVSLKNFGALGQNSVTVVNGDVFYRSTDGWRSFIQARREFGLGWGNTPISAEMTRVLADDAPALDKFCSSVLFDNRLLCTVTPRRLDLGNCYFNGIMALDFEPISAMKRKSPPIWEGLWTGIHPYLLVTCTWEEDQHCLVFTDEPGGIGLWEISRHEPFDGGDGRIESWIEYPALRFQDSMKLKKLQSFKTWVSKIVGSVDFTLKWKVDDSACWITWATRNRCSKRAYCHTEGCYTPQNIEPGYKPHMGFGLPPDVGEAFNGLNARFGYQYLFRLEWIGHARIKRTLVTADVFDLQVIGNEDADEE